MKNGALLKLLNVFIAKKHRQNGQHALHFLAASYYTDEQPPPILEKLQFLLIFDYLTLDVFCLPVNEKLFST